MSGTCPRCGVSVPAGPAATGRDYFVLSLLEMSLTVSVATEIARLSRLPWDTLKTAAEASAEAVASHADDLLYGGKHCASTHAALARGLAVLSFAPGGVSILGWHWCAKHPSVQSSDGQYGK